MLFALAPLGYGSLVGLLLGLTGGGGSILAIPILVYGLALPLSEAIALSLLMVGSIALFGAVRQSSTGNVDWRRAVLFSLAGMLASPLALHFTDDVNESLRLFLFALLMLFIAYKMAFVSPREAPTTDYFKAETKRSVILKTVGGGTLSGTLSGFFGVGGGFIIVPLLTLIFSLPYHKAVGTSLACIFLISTTAIAGALVKGISVDWPLFSMFVGGGFAGMMAGSALINQIPERIARITFAAITATLAIFMLIDKLFISQGGLS